MPELPEVEVTRLGLLPVLPGRLVTGITSSGKKLRQPLPLALLDRWIKGTTLVTVDRRAKYLLARFANGSTLVIHLGMTGKLSIVPAAEPPALHDHLRLRLDNGTELRFNDSRRFGAILVWPPDRATALEREFSRNLGVEPLSNDLHVCSLRRRSRTRKLAVKNFLMDGRIIAGIGNIYANEILHRAAVHPLTPAHELRYRHWQRIIGSTRFILNQAIAAGGSTIADFLGASGNPGYFQLQFAVYGRQGLPCPRCGQTIVKTVIGGRATYFCPACQPRPAETAPRNT